ncbi:unnamed protein product [Mytilus edulis]|uniref:Integrase zinc-binding domain-containing protein n=1 Tax=Mytilus edulis TaxID=6550 RepID=A0A8S3TR33_MYTED|nr:unnamed protein product [Mytilus edulis]
MEIDHPQADDIIIQPKSNLKGLLSPNALIAKDESVKAVFRNDTDTFITLKGGHKFGIGMEIYNVVTDQGDLAEDPEVHSDRVSVNVDNANSCKTSENISDRFSVSSPTGNFETLEKVRVGDRVSAGPSQGDRFSVSPPQGDRFSVSPSQGDRFSVNPSQGDRFSVSPPQEIRTILKDGNSVNKLNKLKELNSKIPEHLKDLYTRTVKDFDIDRSIKIAEVLIEFQNIFSKGDMDLGLFNGDIKHRIHTGEAAAIKQQMRRTPLKFENEEEKHLSQMLDKGVIKPSISDWCSCPVLVRKKDGSLRYCIDFRPLNKVTTKDVFPLPKIESCMDTLRGSAYMSTLDMAADTLNECNSYLPSIPLNNLPCGGCKYCTRARSQWSTFEEEVDFVKPLTVRAPYTENELRDAQKNDIDLSTVIAWLSTDFSPSKQDLQMSSPLVRHLWQSKSQLEFRNGILYYFWDDAVAPRLLFITPRKLRQEMLHLCHDLRSAGHLGQDKTLAKLRHTVYWYGMTMDCKLYVSTCHICNRYKKPLKRAKAELGREIPLWLQRLRNDILGRAENKLERDTNMELEDLYLDILFSGENQNTQNGLNPLSESLTDDLDNNDPFLVSDSLTNNYNNEQIIIKDLHSLIDIPSDLDATLAYDLSQNSLLLNSDDINRDTDKLDNGSKQGQVGRRKRQMPSYLHDYVQ